MKALSTVPHPGRKQNIAKLGCVQNLDVRMRTVAFTLSQVGEHGESIAQRCRAAIQKIHGKHVDVKIAIKKDTSSRAQNNIGLGANNLIAVASGKGGVGKSTVAANLAAELARRGFRTGLVDTDIYGPSVPTMFGVEDERPRVVKGKIQPLYKHGVVLLSMGLLVDPDRAVIWRGPMVSSAVRQFLGDADWGELDFMILDLPPGTGDIQLTIVQTVSLTGAVIVSTPQRVALADARKGVAMFGQVNVPVLGIIENMAYFSPPDDQQKRYYLFGKDGAKRLAEKSNLRMLGEVPIEQRLRESGDDGTPVVISDPNSISARAFRGAVDQLIDAVAEQGPKFTTLPEIEYR